MAGQETPSTAATLSILGGLLILLSGILIIAMGTAFAGMMAGYYPGMMGGYYPGMMGNPAGFISPLIVGIGIGGIICGIVIAVSGYWLNTRPAAHTTWGMVIVVVSLVSFFEGGGFLIGAILGILGGILAITWKPSPAGTETKGTG